MEMYELQQMQQLPLDIKILKSNLRIREWYEYYDGDVYISFSGGKDSTVLLHLVRSIYPNVPAVFCDTGLEFPEIKDFVRQTPNITWIKPKMKFNNVIKEYGYPFPSKEQAQYIRQCTVSEHMREKRLVTGYNGKFMISKKWRCLVDAPFKVSDHCCDIMKKKPFKEYEKETGNHPYIGTMANESILRKSEQLKWGCNAFKANRPISKPMGFWTEKDVWDYIKQYNIQYSKIYDMGYERTGCMFCMFGIHLEKEPNRFQHMKITHPNQYNYCINTLGCKDVLDYCNIPY